MTWLICTCTLYHNTFLTARSKQSFQMIGSERWELPLPVIACFRVFWARRVVLILGAKDLGHKLREYCLLAKTKTQEASAFLHDRTNGMVMVPRTLVILYIVHQQNRWSHRWTNRMSSAKYKHSPLPMPLHVKSNGGMSYAYVHVWMWKWGRGTTGALAQHTCYNCTCCAIERQKIRGIW